MDLGGIFVKVEIIEDRGKNGTAAVIHTSGLPIEAVIELLRSAAKGLEAELPVPPAHSATMDDELQQMLDLGD